MCAASSSTEGTKDWIRSGAVALGAAAMVLLSNGASDLAMADEGVPEFQTYYGTAASASSYGGYGGNANKKDSAEYIFNVPQVSHSELTRLSRVDCTYLEGAPFLRDCNRSVGLGME